MQTKLVLRPEVEEDLQSAYTWYENCRDGLGEEFLDCVDGCFQKICRMPTILSVANGGFRRAMVARFPYVVFYEYEEPEIVDFAVFHSASNPLKWEEKRR